ncbi:unnamed protein product (macronuclear) [Paramecium tetraurelia]|uniref:BTB domain-containing protein n=1 Tax=Paramecium tetraurelia TaxID=5888 RepID=A0DQI2_PARTE|nr:uncharacterized protein GSPATT00002699001 [Paramecium tetraurelia]CAK85299.1 unnamed protein product [Paramecium tetraurelia]|eukprot:XP_001452696.1 hypothetical protein (macronuclear) [Paramecium tetraurelia strain d4-2]
MNSLATLKFVNIENNDLQSHFPIDPNADIILVLNGKETFQLQIRLLKKRSQYFETQLHNSDSKFKVIPGKHDGVVFQKILNCFYGYQYHIYKAEEFYSAYKISHFLQINNFITTLQDSLYENFQRIDIHIVLTLAELYEIESLREKYIDYLDENPQLWKIILPIQKLEFYRQNYYSICCTKQNDDIPINVLHLKEDILIKLLSFHNEQKNKKSFPEKFLTPDDILKIIQFQTQEERQENTIKIVNSIYKVEDIYSDNDARRLQTFMGKSYSSSVNSSSCSDRSSKLIIEQQRDIEELKMKLQCSIKENNELQLKSKMLEERIENLQQLIENQKKTSINASNLNNSNSQDIESSQFVLQQVAESIPLESSSIDQSDNTFFKSQLHFNSTPQTVFTLSELSYLGEILNAKIYQQIKFKLLYRGTENNFYLASEEQLTSIKKATSILILIRSVDNDSVFGIFNQNSRIQIINFQSKKRVDYKKELKLAINSNYLLKLGNDIEIFVDCCNKKNNICNNINGLGCLAGKTEFQVDELEIYECSIHNEIV